jgi:hypothetical protein
MLSILVVADVKRIEQLNDGGFLRKTQLSGAAATSSPRGKIES